MDFIPAHLDLRKAAHRRADNIFCLTTVPNSGWPSLAAAPALTHPQCNDADKGAIQSFSQGVRNVRFHSKQNSVRLINWKLDKEDGLVKWRQPENKVSRLSSDPLANATSLLTPLLH